MTDITVASFPTAAGLQLRLRGGEGKFVPQSQSMPDKFLRDGQRLKERARWVIVVDEKGTMLNFINNEAYVANIIAVLGPAVANGVALSESLLLEIGISRGRPYMQAESHKKGGRAERERMQSRSKAAQISFEQLEGVWPSIINIIEESIITAREKWKYKEAWFFRTELGLRVVERGISLSISHTDPTFLHEAFLSRDVEVRRYLYKNARSIEYFLRGNKFVYYPEKQLKSFAGVRKVVDLWKNMSGSPRWSPRYARRVLNSLSPQKRALFEHVADVFCLDIGDGFEINPALQKKARSMPFLKHLRVRLEGEGKRHGKGCTMFEVYFERSHRERYNL